MYFRVTQALAGTRTRTPRRSGSTAARSRNNPASEQPRHPQPPARPRPPSAPAGPDGFRARLRSGGPACLFMLGAQLSRQPPGPLAPSSGMRAHATRGARPRGQARSQRAPDRPRPRPGDPKGAAAQAQAQSRCIRKRRDDRARDPEALPASGRKRPGGLRRSGGCTLGSLCSACLSRPG